LQAFGLEVEIRNGQRVLVQVGGGRKQGDSKNIEDRSKTPDEKRANDSNGKGAAVEPVRKKYRLLLLAPGKSGKYRTRQETFVGVFTAQLADALAAQLSDVLGRGQGLLVTGVMPGSPAEKAGITKNDVLATYDDQKLFNTPQLRQLVVSSQPGRVVRFGVVRRAKLQSLEVTPAVRTVPMNLRIEVPRVFKFPGRLRQLDHKTIIIDGSQSQDFGTGLRPDEATGKKPDDNVKSQTKPGILHKRSVVITTADGKRYRVQVSQTDSHGKTKSHTFNGDLEEIRRQLDKFPAEIRDPVRDSLDRIGPARNGGRAFRLQLRPGIEGTGRRLHLRLQQPGDNGAIRILELDLGSNREITIDDLLQVKILEDQLKQLPPEMRGRVKSTLRQTGIPGIRVKVERSQ
jgi:hypothetical protein